MNTRATGGQSLAEDVVFSNFGPGGLGDDIDQDVPGGNDDDVGDDFEDDDVDDPRDRDPRDSHDGDDDLDELAARQDDRDGLDQLNDRQRQRVQQPRGRRDQFGRGDRRDPRQQQMREEQQLLNDLGVSHTDQRRELETKMDKQGNVVNVKTGQVVARSGREARYYLDGVKARREVATANTRMRDVEGRLAQAIKIGNNLDTQLSEFRGHEAKLKQLGMSAQDELSALRLFSDLKSNPIQAIRTILTQAQRRGITMEQLGMQGGNVPLDARTLAEQINQENNKLLQPILEQLTQAQQRERQQQQDAEVNRKSEAEVASFFQANPEASKYIRVFHAMINDPRTQQQSLNEMWANIQLNLMRQRMTRPGGGDQRSQRSSTLRPRGSMPRGRGAPQGSSRPDAVADPMLGYDDIIHDILDGVPGFERVA